jgi:glucose/arabinose dehydrogenase
MVTALFGVRRGQMAFGFGSADAGQRACAHHPATPIGRIHRSIRAAILGSALAAAALAAPSYEIQDILLGTSASASRSTSWKPGDGLVLEVSGMDFLADGRLAVAVRKGEVWLIDGLRGPTPGPIRTTLFASGLHEPLGLLRDGDSLLVTQRTEVTRLRDTDGDGVADEYLTAGRGWNVSGAYHGYAYGPKRDGAGRLWVALNVDMGDRSDNAAAWRGWAGTIGPRGEFDPMAAGMRSPCGLGANAAGDMFCVDQQGTWIPTTPIYHLRRGAFYLNPEGIASQDRPGSPLKLSAAVPTKVPYPEAVRALPEMVPPAVWLPYNKMGRSGTDLAVCPAGGKFGPFDGQFFVGEFTDAKVSRVFLEKVGGEYQGAAFPFVAGLASGVVRVLFGPDGQLYAGLTSRGWSSLGPKSYGLQRIRWTGVRPFALRAMRAERDGFELEFTDDVDPATAGQAASYVLRSYTHLYSGAYGSAEINGQTHRVTQATVGADRRHVRLQVEGLRELHVHELRAEGVRSAQGAALDHPDAYYTLNRIPR